MRAPLIPAARRLRRRGGPGQSGFTLMELLMVIAISTAFAVGLYAFFFAGLDAANTDQSQTRAQAGLRTTMELFTRDVRQAVSADDGINGGIFSLSANSIVINVDPNRDPRATVPRPQRVRYQLVGTQLLRDVAQPIGSTPPYSYTPFSPPVVMAEPIQNGGAALFQAFTEQGVALPAPVAQPRDIKTVRIHLIVGQKTGNKATTTELSTDVTLRNTSKF